MREPTEAQVAAFKQAWEAEDTQRETDGIDGIPVQPGARTRAGLRAVFALKDDYLDADERAAIAALIENEMNEGSSKFGKVGYGLVRLGALLEKFEEDEPEVPYPDGAPEPSFWDDRANPS